MVVRKRFVPGIPRLTIDRGNKHYRGGQIRSMDGATASIRLHREQFLIIDRTCATSLLSAGAQAGNPICCEVTDPSGDCTIVAVHDTRPADHALEAAYFQNREVLSVGCVPKELGGN